MTAPTTVTDEQLVLNASRGDHEAFSLFYERHYRGVYDLSVRMVRDPDTAADIVQETFVNAYESLRKRTITGNVKAWLYTIGRNNAINELRRGKRTEPVRDTPLDARPPAFFARVDPDRMANPETALEDQEMADLVWNSAAALSPREYSLLDLHLRRGLTADELSATMGVSKGNLYTSLSRLRDSLEESVTVALLARRGRGDCPELDALIAARAGGELDRSLRLGVRQHIQQCDRCQNSRRRYLAPAEIFAGLALVPIPAGMDVALWPRIAAGMGAGAGLIGSIFGPVGKLVGDVAGWWGGKASGVRDGAIAAGAVGAGGFVAVMLLIISPGGSDQPPTGVLGASELPFSQDMVTPTNDPTPTSIVFDIPAEGTATPTPLRTADSPPVPTSTPVPDQVVVVPTPTSTPAPTPRPPSAPTPTSTPTFVPTPTQPPIVTLEVQINVRSATDPKGINAGSNAVIQAVVYATASLTAADIDASSVRLDAASAVSAKFHDDNGDGLDDLVFHVRASEIGLAPGDVLICLTGRTFDGRHFQGCEFVRILGN